MRLLALPTLLLASSAALADSTATITYGVVLEPLMPVLGIVLTALSAWVAQKLVAYLTRLGVVQDQAHAAQLSAAITGAASRGAGIAYQVLATQATHINDMPVRNEAMAAAVNYVHTMMPDTIKALGLTPDQVHAMVQGELGKLLAVDPTVAIPPPPVNAAAG